MQCPYDDNVECETPAICGSMGCGALMAAALRAPDVPKPPAKVIDAAHRFRPEEPVDACIKAASIEACSFPGAVDAARVTKSVAMSEAFAAYRAVLVRHGWDEDRAKRHLVVVHDPDDMIVVQGFIPVDVMRQMLEAALAQVSGGTYIVVEDKDLPKGMN